MSRKSQQASSSRSELNVESIGEAVSTMIEKGMAVDFDVTVEVSSRRLRLGTLRVYGRLQSGAHSKR